MIMITGATGLIGSHLLLHLLQEEGEIRALYRTEEKKQRTIDFLKHQGVNPSQLAQLTWIRGNINDIPTLSDALTGVTRVYHCAALISFDTRKYHKLRKVNIDGTANVVNTCLEKGVKKLCYLSSIAALGKPQDGSPVTESQAWHANLHHSVYAITKYGAENEVWRGGQEGLECVIINPGVVLGEGIWEHSTKTLFTTVIKQKKYYPPGGTGFVDVKDVCRAMVTAMNSDISQKRFILVGENLKFRQLFEHIGRILHLPPPPKKISAWVLHLIWRLDWLRSTLTGSSRKLTKAMADSLLHTTTYNAERSEEMLGLEYTPVEETLARIAEYNRAGQKT